MSQYVYYWIGCGYFGWLALMNYSEIRYERQKTVTITEYANGFTISLLLGPLCFVALLMWILLKRNSK